MKSKIHLALYNSVANRQWRRADVFIFSPVQIEFFSILPLQSALRKHGLKIVWVPILIHVLLTCTIKNKSAFFNENSEATFFLLQEKNQSSYNVRLLSDPVLYPFLHPFLLLIPKMKDDTDDRCFTHHTCTMGISRN